MKRFASFAVTAVLTACSADPGAVGPLPPGSEGGAGGSGPGGSGPGGSGLGGSGLGGSTGVAGASGAAGSTAAGASGASGMGGSDGGAGAAGAGGQAPSCGVADAAAITGVEVAQVDVLGWAPYSVDGCSLVYVAVSSTGDKTKSGPLRLRSLPGGSETTIADESEAPRRPTVRGDLIAWEATIGGKSVVRVKVGAAAPITLSGPFDHAGEPRAGEAGVAFTAWLTAADLGDTDVYLFDRAAAAVVPIAVGPAQQRWADVSATHVAYSDFLEDKDGTFNDNSTDVCDIGLFDLSTKTGITYAKIGKQAYPMLGSKGFAVFLEWPADHPEPKNVEYGLHSWGFASPAQPDVELSHVIHNDPYYARPATRDGVVTWVASAPSDTLFRIPVAGGTPTPMMVNATNLRTPTMTASFVTIAGLDATSAAKLTVGGL